MLRTNLLKTVPAIVFSAAAFVAAFVVPAGVDGQPQAKAKTKAKNAPYKTVTVATGLWHPWSLAWLPNGDMLVSERNGKVRMIRDNRLDPDAIAGVPPVHSV